MNSTTSATSLPPSAAPLATKKTSMLWDTNFNLKMDCDSFLHIDIFPSDKPRPSELSIKQTVFVIATKDGSHAPVERLIDDILFMRLRDLFGMLTAASHGMDLFEFAKYFTNKYKGSTPDTGVMICTYSKPGNVLVNFESRKLGSVNGLYWNI